MNWSACALLTLSVFAGCVTDVSTDGSDSDMPHPTSSLAWQYNTTRQGSLAWLFHLSSPEPARCDLVMNATGVSSEAKPVLGFGKWVSADLTSSDPDGVFSFILTNEVNDQVARVSASAGGQQAAPLERAFEADWGVSSGTRLLSGTDQWFLVAFDDLQPGVEVEWGRVMHDAENSVEVAIGCDQGSIDGPLELALVSMVTHWFSENGTGAVMTSGSGMHLLDAGQGATMSWNRRASLVLGHAGSGAGGGMTKIRIESPQQSNEWIFAESQDVASTASGFFSLDWDSGAHLLQYDVASPRATSSTLEAIIVDVSPACSNSAACGLPLPIAATPQPLIP